MDAHACLCANAPGQAFCSCFLLPFASCQGVSQKIYSLDVFQATLRLRMLECHYLRLMEF